MTPEEKNKWELEKDSRDRDTVLRKFYVEQRDKHLQQIIAINGQGTFGSLAVVGAILIGGLGLKKGNLADNIFCSLIPWFIVVGIGIGLLFAAAATFSYFHTTRVKRFEDLIRNPKEFSELDNDEFQIMPKKSANYLVFFGLITLLIGVFGILLNLINKTFG